MVHRTLLATLCCSKRKIAGWGETALFHRPLDLMSLDSVFLGYIKIAVYDVVGQVDSSGTFKHRIAVATETVTTKTQSRYLTHYKRSTCKTSLMQTLSSFFVFVSFLSVSWLRQYHIMKQNVFCEPVQQVISYEKKVS
jgi:hypothetical protein